MAVTPLDLLDALWTLQNMLEGLGAEPRVRWAESASDLELKRQVDEACEAIRRTFLGARPLAVLSAERFVARRAEDHVRELMQLQEMLVDGVRRKDLGAIPFARIIDLAMALKNGLPSPADASSNWP